jgi:hypothetical protein
MSSLTAGAGTISRAARDLEQLLQRDRGPAAAEVRAIVDRIYVGTGLLMAAAGNLEMGIED